jgi:hypothetical protein
LRQGRFRQRRRLTDDDENPMEGAINIVDAMLVFACGLMLSLVIYWNVDLRSNDMIPVKQGAEAVSAEEIAGQEGEGTPEDGGFIEVGKVYRDPETGKLYLAESVDNLSAGGLGAASPAAVGAAGGGADGAGGADRADGADGADGAERAGGADGAAEEGGAP